MNPNETGELWVAYESPPDFPGRFVARRWQDGGPSAEFVSAATARDLAEKLVRLPGTAPIVLCRPHEVEETLRLLLGEP